MSTSETVEFAVGPCPCGSGAIVKSVTTQDNPWSSADISYGINCPKCAGAWDITSGTLTNRESARPHQEAYRAERQASAELHVIVDELVDRYFEDFGAKTMTAELREMQRLGISTMNIAQFRKAVHEGRRPLERSYALKNPDWLFSVAKEAEKEEAFVQLRDKYNDARARTADTAKAVIRRRIPNE